MSAKLNWIERIGFYKLNEGPFPMLDLINALSYKAILIALKLDIFEILNNKILSLEDIANKLNADKRGLTILLNTLEPLGYIQKENNKYTNTEMTVRWMLKESPDNITGMFGLFDDMIKRWDYLDDAILNGKPKMAANEWLDKSPDRWRRYHIGMRCIANLLGNQVVNKIKISKKAKTLLDLGGSHGRFAIKFCEKNPNLNAVIFDSKEAKEITNETINIDKLNDRVVFKEGDFFKDDIGKNYDVILLFNVIRIFPKEAVIELLNKAVSALNNKGKIIIMDQFGNKNLSNLFKVNEQVILLELFNSSIIGYTHSFNDIVTILNNIGLKKIDKMKLSRSPGVGLIIGNKTQ